MDRPTELLDMSDKFVVSSGTVPIHASKGLVLLLYYQDWRAINTFAKLPSLRSIITWTICIDDDVGDSDYLLQPQKSSVSSLTLSGSSVDLHLLYDFLQGFKALNRLSYGGGNGAPSILNRCIPDSYRALDTCQSLARVPRSYTNRR